MCRMHKGPDHVGRLAEHLTADRVCLLLLPSMARCIPCRLCLVSPRYPFLHYPKFFVGQMAKLKECPMVDGFLFKIRLVSEWPLVSDHYVPLSSAAAWPTVEHHSIAAWPTVKHHMSTQSECVGRFVGPLTRSSADRVLLK